MRGDASRGRVAFLSVILAIELAGALVVTSAWNHGYRSGGPLASNSRVGVIFPLAVGRDVTWAIAFSPDPPPFPA